MIDQFRQIEKNYIYFKIINSHIFFKGLVRVFENFRILVTYFKQNMLPDLYKTKFQIREEYISISVKL